MPDVYQNPGKAHSRGLAVDVALRSLRERWRLSLSKQDLGSFPPGFHGRIQVPRGYALKSSAQTGAGVGKKRGREGLEHVTWWG